MPVTHEQIMMVMRAALQESESMLLTPTERARYLANRLWIRLTLETPRRWPWFVLGVVLGGAVAWAQC